MKLAYFFALFCLVALVFAGDSSTRTNVNPFSDGYYQASFNANGDILVEQCDQDYCSGIVVAQFLGSSDTGSSFVESGAYDMSIRTFKEGCLASDSVEDCDNRQAYAAGYLDAYLFHSDIWNHNHNANNFMQRHYNGGDGWSNAAYEWLNQNLYYTRKIARTLPADETSVEYKFYRHLQILLFQFDGIVDGYNAGVRENAGKYSGDYPPQPLNEQDMWAYEAMGDLLDLLNAVNPDLTSLWNPNDHNVIENREYNLERDHCSGIFLLDNLNDFTSATNIYFGQAAWFGLVCMTRVARYFEYDFSTNTPGRIQRLSSYPGFVFSFDDWYGLSSGLGIIETTHDIYDNSLLRLIVPDTLLTWVRCALANRVASSGTEWATAFSLHNSGSYNNQYAIIDIEKFNAWTQLTTAQKTDFTLDANKGVFTIVEQAPGPDGIKTNDMWEWLVTHGYWPSFNTPYDQSIRELLGIAQRTDPTNPSNYDIIDDWYNNPRHRILRNWISEVQSNQTDVDPTAITGDDFFQLMRLNKWDSTNTDDLYLTATDPLNINPDGNGHDLVPTSGSAIASRYDLRMPTDYDTLLSGSTDAIGFGAMDAKYASVTDFSNPATDADYKYNTIQMHGEFSPTHEDQPIFFFGERPGAFDNYDRWGLEHWNDLQCESKLSCTQWGDRLWNNTVDV
ncbi:Phospholipase B-like protein [Aduncisulcus paluster]|uniref:Phospholipase B-like n=1 Tax=Aduncisulcus paluster TaxID=2918883 RepID=A0ABQ5KJT1_9EUKA|nr:Phospholipase B-like protein [Aduncisulcus paluster]